MAISKTNYQNQFNIQLINTSSQKRKKERKKCVTGSDSSERHFLISIAKRLSRLKCKITVH